MMHVRIGETGIAVPSGASLLAVSGELGAAFMVECALQPRPKEFDAWMARLERTLQQSVRPQPWSVLRVSPNMERKVVAALGEAGLTVYVPLERYRPRGRLKALHRPLMPGYAFARICTDRDLDLARANYAVRLMTRDGSPVTVEAEVIGGLVLFEACREFDTAKDTRPVRGKRSRRSAPLRNWEQGQRVKIADGPFAGFPADIVKADRADRIELLVSIFGRATPLEMDEAMLEGWDEVTT